MSVFSQDGYFKHTPVWVKKVLLAIKGILGTAAGATYFSDHADWGFWILASGGAIDELSKFIKDDEPKPPTPTQDCAE